MIIGSWQQSQQLLGLQEELQQIAVFLQAQAGVPFVKQQVRLTETITANFLEYQTGVRTERVWEAHKKDIDLHVMVMGNEAVDLAAEGQLVAQEYHEVEDYYLLTGTATTTLLLQTGQFLLLLPEEPHRTGVQTGSSQIVQKIVFKIRKAG